MSSISNPLLTGGGSTSAVRGGFFVTVADPPTAADYTSISGALAAPFNAIYVIGDTTEPEAITIPSSGLSITFLNDANLNLGDQNFSWVSSVGASIQGNGQITSTAATLFDFAGNTGRLDVNGVEITVSSGTILTDGTDGRFSDVLFSSGIVLDGTRNMITASNISFLEIASTAINSVVTDSLVDNPIIDGGSGTILADIKEY